jgi:sugar (pentulose or hexulose) kinase
MIERLSFDVVSFAGYEVTGPIRFTGGGSNNHSWNQLRSTMLNRGAMVPDEAGSAAGAAILARAAAEGAQRHNFDEIVNQMVTIRAEIEPDRELFGVMRDKYKNLVAELLRRGWISHDLDAYVGRNLD